ncbi:MAG: hypothetical protein Q4B58_07825 [Bacteroidales bacterium]|nr:hypothetical protein [Bacteroidales bacterium]
MTDKFYGIQREAMPIAVKILPRDRSQSPYIGYQCDSSPDDEGEIIASFLDVRDIWDNLHINGDSLEVVLRRSFITSLT